MKSPEVHFIVYVQYTFTLQEMLEFVVNISQSHVTPEPLNSLVMSAPASDGIASSRSPENDHNTERIVFSSMIHIWPRRLSSNALQYLLRLLLKAWRKTIRWLQLLIPS